MGRPSSAPLGPGELDANAVADILGAPLATVWSYGNKGRITRLRPGVYDEASVLAIAAAGTYRPAVKVEWGVEEEAWLGDALCKGSDPEWWHPPRGASLAAQKAVCAECTVRAECLEYAMRTHQTVGVWGGTSERERRRIRQSARQLESEVA